MTDKLPEKMSGLLSNEQLTKHRTNIMIEVEAILSSHYQAETSSEVKYKILLNWVNMLQDFTPQEVLSAFRQQMIDEPRRKPNEGMIYNRIQEARKRRLAALPKPNIEHYVLKKNPDSEQRSKLSKELLGNIKTFGGEH